MLPHYISAIWSSSYELMLDHPYFCCMVFLAIPALFLGKSYFSGGRCHLKKDLSDKIIVITGAANGTGYETAKSLAKLGANIIFACKNK